MLTPKQRQYLKAQAHHLKPAVHVGKGGASAGLAAELDQMLESLELIKIKLNQNAAEDPDAVMAVLKGQVQGIEHVWTIGHTLLVFRASRNKPSAYDLPKTSSDK
ncbi:MAG TPA: YhbY family RNA-binding protein [Holophaga sp.]|jgi:RNA-binding protein|nr:YhbY family RNA-binding protein [Holophaga sp.]